MRYSRKVNFLVFFVPLIVIAADQGVKFFLEKKYPFLVSYNPSLGLGIDFGIANSEFYLSLAVVLILIYVLIFRKISSKYYFSLMLILGGGVSNLMDRIFRPGVADYFILGSISIFNIADAIICVGLCLMLILVARGNQVISD